jgi:hypothetical protein
MDTRFMKTRDDFSSVYGNLDDQVIVRRLIEELVPENIKQEIVWRFNKYVSERNLRIIELDQEDG